MSAARPPGLALSGMAASRATRDVETCAVRGVHDHWSLKPQAGLIPIKFALLREYELWYDDC
jgi:hypothetical protein